MILNRLPMTGARVTPLQGLVVRAEAAFQPDSLVSRRVAADTLGISERTLERLAVTGGGPPMVAIGRRRLYRLASLASWADANTVNSTSAVSARKPAGR